MKTIWILAAAVMLLGASVFERGSNLPLYRDEEEFQRRYMQIQPEWKNARRLYRELRSEFITRQIFYHDYGVTLVIIGGLLALIPAGDRMLFWAEQKRWRPLLIGVLAACGTAVSELISLFRDQARGEFPWFADAIVIPIAGLTPVVFAFSGWSLFNWLACQWVQRHIGSATHWHYLIWLRLLMIGSVFAVFCAAARADYFTIVPGLLWLAFYFLLWRSVPIFSCRAMSGRGMDPGGVH